MIKKVAMWKEGSANGRRKLQWRKDDLVEVVHEVGEAVGGTEGHVKLLAHLASV